MKKNYSRLKKEFQEDLFPVLRKTVGIGLILIIILVPAFAWVDYFYYPEYFHRFLYYRLSAAALASLLFYLNIRSSTFHTTKLIGILGFYVVGLCIVLMIKDVNGFGTPYYAGLFLAFTGFIAIVPFDVMSHLFHVLVIYLCYVAVVLRSGGDHVPRLFYVNNVFLLSCLSILLTASAFNYRKRIEEFVGRKRLLEAEDCLRKYAERLKRNVKESESKYASVVNNAREGILILRDGKVRFCNPTAMEILGVMGGGSDEENVLDSVPAVVRKTILLASERAVRKGRSTINQEMELAEPSFPKKWYEYTAVPVELGDGQACVLFLRDITERKHMEDELIRSQKMEAIGVMAGGVAHDLNNIFQIVSGYVQMGLEMAERASRLHYFLSQIEKTVGRASMVARQLLIFARKDEGKKEVLDINSQIVSLTKLLHRVIPKMITIDLRLSADAGFVLADPVKLEQVLLNLCINARDAMPDGGRLEISTVRTTSLPEDTGMTGRDYAEEGSEEYVCIAIADTGIGIPPEVKERIFEPFFTTKEKGKGTGLGLAIVYGIVKDHNGFITCRSRKGGGTVFSVYLPVCRDKEEPSKAMGGEPEDHGPQNGNILLVDDEEQIRDIGTNVLRKAGYRVTAVESGEAALEYMERNLSSLDLILLDLNMPGMGGLRFLRQLNRRFPGHGIRIIICTGYFEKEDIARVKDLGVSHVITKPFKFSEIMPTIRSVLSS